MIIIYGKSNCSFCTKAKNIAEMHNLPYQYHSIDDEQINEQMFKLVPNAKTVPQIWWGDRYIGGYDQFAQEIENTVGNYGHGKL